MPFVKGHQKVPGSGRKKGVNGRQAGIEAFSRSILEDSEYQKNLLTRARAGELAPGMESMLYAYAYGKPVEPERDDEQFLANLLGVIQKYASSPEAQQEIREAVQAYTASGSPLRVVA